MITKATWEIISLMNEEIIIIGNSFSGLGTAIACAKYGYKVKIIAPKNNWGIVGGLQIAPNGLAALSSLDLKEQILSHAVRLQEVDIKLFETSVSLSNIFISSDKSPYVSIARQDLFEILLNKCLNNPYISFVETRVLAISQRNDGTRLMLETGDVVSAPIIIGADGWSGKTRQFVSPFARQSDSGYSIYRGIFPASELPSVLSYPNVQLWLGKSCHLVSYPIQNRRTVNFVFVFSDSAFPSLSIEAIFHNHPALPMLGNNPDNWHLTQIKQFELLSNWRRGGVTLIGDAAHPMPPHLAQGAGQSFMDVACIENNLSNGLTLQESIFDMITNRMPKVHSVAKKSQLSGTIFRFNEPAASLRNKIISIAGQTVINDFLKDLWLIA